MNALSRVPTTVPSVLAFEFSGRIESQDIDAMAEQVNDAFDRHDTVSLVLIFRDWQGIDASAALDPDLFAAQARSLTNVNRYAVVGAPEAARGMIDALDPLIPVDAQTYGLDEESEAWGFVGARPAPPASRGTTPPEEAEPLRR